MGGIAGMHLPNFALTTQLQAEPRMVVEQLLDKQWEQVDPALWGSLKAVRLRILADGHPAQLGRSGLAEESTQIISNSHD